MDSLWKELVADACHITAHQEADSSGKQAGLVTFNDLLLVTFLHQSYVLTNAGDISESNPNKQSHPLQDI